MTLLSASWRETVYRSYDPDSDIDEDRLYPTHGSHARFVFMEDILANVELHSPDDFPSIDALRSFLLETGSTPGDFEENCLKEEEALREETEERTLFCGYIQSLTDEALRAVEPLPFHRPLEDQREEQFRRRLWETWGVPEKGGWYQIVGGEKPPPPHILAFNTWEFGERIPLDLLRACQRLRPVL